ncbi:MAG: cytochrome c [Candidatus Thiodiazotropha sp. 'RUGA']|nr:cytochrome c [Candidatus Thiodiazotropha sp. 'RUGA']
MIHKKQFWLVAIPAILLAALSSYSVAEQERSFSLLPDSLSQWYKPENKRQVWLHTMFALRRELQAVDEYAAERDLELTRKWTDKFTAHYRKLPEMVPEWQDEVELEETERLETAAQTGDFENVASAVSRLQRNCRNCHREYRVLAALRYRSPDFSKIEIVDDQGRPQEYGDHMETLSQTINRIKIASVDNRWSHAQKAVQQLRGQLQRLAESCDSCHKDELPRQRILGDASVKTLDELDEALTQQQPKMAGRKLGEAAVVICARCHGVHRSLSDTRSFVFD